MYKKYYYSIISSIQKGKRAILMSTEKTKEFIYEKAIYIMAVPLYFFLSAFYTNQEEGLQKMAEMNTTLTVAVSEMTEIKQNVKENSDDIKKLNDGFINLQTRVGYLEQE